MQATRRAVVSAHKPYVGGAMHHNYWECTLTCGHTVTAYGKRRPGTTETTPPKTCTCHKCAKPEPTK